MSLIIKGDCIEELKKLPENSVDAIMRSIEDGG